MFNNVQEGANMANTAQQTAEAHTQATHRHVAPLPAEGYARLPQILAVIPVSKSTWWNGCKSGKYPKPVKLGPRTTAWRVSDIRALIAAA